MELIDQYTLYIDRIQPLFYKSYADDEEKGRYSCAFYDSDDSLLLNRDPRYLKESTWDYFQDQSLTGLFGHIEQDAWHEYTDYIMREGQKERLLKCVDNTPKIAPKIVHKKQGTKNQRAASFATQLLWPIDRHQFWLSSRFGPRRKKDGSRGFHYGIDLAALKGTPVKAVKAGRVEQVQRAAAGYGNNILIDHGSGIKTRYAHLHSIAVRKGQQIAQGAMVGKVGETGFIRKKTKDGSHLHFEVYDHGKHVNPLSLLPSLY